jgi:hypothetical protein
MSAGRRYSPVQASAALLAAICLLLGPILCARLCQLSDLLVRAQTAASSNQVLALHHAGMNGHADESEQLPVSHPHPPLEQMKQLMLGVTEALPRLILFAAVLIALGSAASLDHRADSQHSPDVPHPPPRPLALLTP